MDYFILYYRILTIVGIFLYKLGTKSASDKHKSKNYNYLIEIITIYIWFIVFIKVAQVDWVLNPLKS